MRSNKSVTRRTEHDARIETNLGSQPPFAYSYYYQITHGAGALTLRTEHCLGYFLKLKHQYFWKKTTVWRQLSRRDAADRVCVCVPRGIAGVNTSSEISTMAPAARKTGDTSPYTHDEIYTYIDIWVNLNKSRQTPTYMYAAHNSTRRRRRAPRRSTENPRRNCHHIVCTWPCRCIELSIGWLLSLNR